MTRQAIHLLVDDRTEELWVEPNDTLQQVLHDELGLADVRYGCGEGVCGTCTVLVDGEPVNGCLQLAVQSVGTRITTLRSVAGPNAELHPLQRQLLERGAAQCGFCTPGVTLTALDLSLRNPAATRDEIRHALVGNLCRCTGYTKMVDAIAAYLAELHVAQAGVR